VRHSCGLQGCGDHACLRLRVTFVHSLQARVVACVTDMDTSAEAALGPELLAKLRGADSTAGSELYEFVLALRGLLGGGILKHGLALRNQVDYGIDR
jgi:hypothetical protein